MLPSFIQIIKRLPIALVAISLTTSSTGMTFVMMVSMQDTPLTKTLAGVISIGLSAAMFLFPAYKGGRAVTLAAKSISTFLLIMSCGATVTFMEKVIQHDLKISRSSSIELIALEQEREILLKSIAQLQSVIETDEKNGFRKRSIETSETKLSPKLNQLRELSDKIVKASKSDVNIPVYLQDNYTQHRLLAFFILGVVIDASAMLATIIALSASITPQETNKNREPTNPKSPLHVPELKSNKNKIHNENICEQTEHEPQPPLGYREQTENFTATTPDFIGVNPQISEYAFENKFTVTKKQSGTEIEQIFVPSELEMSMIKFTQRHNKFSSRKFNDKTNESMRKIKAAMKNLNDVGVFIKDGRCYVLGNIAQAY